ncbi:hypothetical protein BH09PLA1_BH09PLA1_30730 [soil metagenome]
MKMLTQDRSISRLRRRGFTLVEMCLGLLVTGFVSAAVAAFLLAVSACWNQSENAQTGAVRNSQFTSRLSQRIRDAKRIGKWRNGSANNAGFIFWQGDANSDGLMQSSELGVVRFNAVDQTIDACTYVVPSGGSDTVWSKANLKDANAIEAFVAVATSATPLIRDVQAATLTVSQEQSTVRAPMASWALDFVQPDGTISQQTSLVSMRAPSTPP